MTAKLSKNQKFPKFDIFVKFWLFVHNYENMIGYVLASTLADKKQIGVQCVLEVFPFEVGWQKVPKILFHQIFKRFHSAMATLEPKKICQS